MGMEWSRFHSDPYTLVLLFVAQDLLLLSIVIVIDMYLLDGLRMAYDASFVLLLLNALCNCSLNSLHLMNYYSLAT